VVHDPTQLNRQGPDVGTSYRSAIFYSDETQKRIAAAYIAQLDAAKVFARRIVTEVTPLKAFYRAEDYHQDYALKNPDNPYIEVCDRPKIDALQKEFPDLFVEYKGKH
jgi:peptide-methionine (S)-S-oxide reductase